MNFDAEIRKQILGVRQDTISLAEVIRTSLEDLEESNRAKSEQIFALWCALAFIFVVAIIK